MPQSIDFDDPAKKVIRLFMRVKSPKDNVTMVIRDGDGNVLASFKRDIVAPGEMEALALPVMKLTDDMKEITVSCEE